MKILNPETTSPISVEIIKEFFENIINNTESNLNFSYGQANTQVNTKGMASILLIAGVLGLSYLVIEKFGDKLIETWLLERKNMNDLITTYDMTEEAYESAISILEEAI